MGKYDDKDKEELIEILEQKDKDLKRKKLGLYWDREIEKEDVVENCENKLPTLVRVEKKSIKEKESTSASNALIEGDNYHALQVLNYTHRGKIDLIYIDPPYNTGKGEGWVYNDKIVDPNDGYRHSKWLNMMEKRLRLAKDLLLRDGVIFISIDDNEIAQLRLLCNEIFGEKNFVNNFMWLHGKGKKTKQSRTLQQYTLCYAKNKHLLGEWTEIKFTSGSFSNPDFDSRGEWFSGSISFSEERSNKNHQNYFSIKSPSGIKWTRQWQYDKDEIDDYLKNNKIYFGTSPKYENVPRLKIFSTDKSEVIPNNIFENMGSTRGAQKELDGIIGKTLEGKSKFENPKPVKLIKTILEISSKKNNMIVLDFFAGSGTTGHAVLKLNKEDGGNRKFILCTNNENKIAEEVTYPRIKSVVKGYKEKSGKLKVDGLGGNLEYFKTDFVENINNGTQLKYNLAQKCGQMLCLKEGIFNEHKSGTDYEIYVSNDKKQYLCIYYNFVNKSFDKFLKDLGNIKGRKLIYMFAEEDDVDEKQFNSIKNKKIIPIPKRILEVYNKIIRDNRR